MKKSMQWYDNTMIRSILNRKINSNNRSGVTGVSYSKYKKKWVAYMKLQGKNLNLGTFKTKEEAIQARLKGEEIYYKPIIDKYNNQCNRERS